MKSRPHTQQAPPAQVSQPLPQMGDDEARIAADLTKARDQMYGALARYRALLADTTLAGNRSRQQKDEQEATFKDLNAFNGMLEQVNVGEGPLALIFTALNSALLLRDQVNELRFQNSLLKQQLDKVSKSLPTPPNP